MHLLQTAVTLSMFDVAIVVDGVVASYSRELLVVVSSISSDITVDVNKFSVVLIKGEIVVIGLIVADISVEVVVKVSRMLSPQSLSGT